MVPDWLATYLSPSDRGVYVTAHYKKTSTHHLESLYMHNSWVLRIVRSLALTANTSTLLFVCGPTTGSLMSSYSACGKKTRILPEDPNLARPRISDPSAQA